MKNNNQVWVDYVRVLATFLVICLHSATPLVYKYNVVQKTDWWTANIYDSITRICVPLFFMISGHLLLEKSEPLKVFFQKRMHKVVVPLLAWSAIYLLWGAYYESTGEITFRSLYSVLLSPAFFHLWFLYALIGIYLFVPLLRLIVKNADKQMLFYYVSLWFFAASIVPFTERITWLKSGFDFLSISGFSGYLVLGLLLGKYTVSDRSAITLLFIFLASAAITQIGTYLLTIRNGGVFSGYFYEYMSPNVVVMSGSMFLLVKYLIAKYDFFHNETLLRVVRSLSSASLGVYLVHCIFLYLLSKGDLSVTISAFEGNPMYSIPATALATFLLSYVTIIGIKNIPILNRITP